MVSMETLFVHAYHAIGRIKYLPPKTTKYFLMCWEGLNTLAAKYVRQHWVVQVQYSPRNSSTKIKKDVLSLHQTGERI